MRNLANLRRSLLLLLTLLLLPACARFQRQPSPAAPTPTLTPAPTVQAGPGEAALSVNGSERRFRFYVPSGYAPASRAALVINFHGYSSDSLQEEKLSGMSLKAEKEGFLVAYPDGLNKGWNDYSGPRISDDLQFVSDLIAYFQSHYAIDPRRVYATGMSNGGGMANRTACELAQQIAAIAPVSGAYNDWRNCRSSRPVPLLAFHGTADQAVPFEGSQGGWILPPILDWAADWAARDGCRPTPQVSQPQQDVKITRWGGCQGNADVVLYAIDGHGHSWPGSQLLPEITSQAVNATDVMWEFFKAHPLP